MKNLSLPVELSSDVSDNQKLLIAVEETAKRALEVLEVQANLMEEADESAKGGRFGKAVVQLITALGKAMGRDAQSVWEEGLKRVMKILQTRSSPFSV